MRTSKTSHSRLLLHHPQCQQKPQRPRLPRQFGVLLCKHNPSQFHLYILQSDTFWFGNKLCRLIQWRIGQTVWHWPCHPCTCNQSYQLCKSRQPCRWNGKPSGKISHLQLCIWTVWCLSTTTSLWPLVWPPRKGCPCGQWTRSSPVSLQTNHPHFPTSRSLRQNTDSSLQVYKLPWCDPGATHDHLQALAILSSLHEHLLLSFEALARLTRHKSKQANCQQLHGLLLNDQSQNRMEI